MHDLIRYVSASSLISNERLDVILKYLYVKDQVERKNNRYLSLYKQHIEFRTFNLEDNKNGSLDFVRDFNLLIESFKNNGFNKKHPITISNINGFNVSGAHRLACALYFNEKVPILFSDEEGLSWNEDWFRKFKFKDFFVDNLLLTYLQLKGKTSTFIVWNSLESKFSEIEENINSTDTDIYYSAVVDLESSKNLIELIKDVYAYQDGPVLDQTIENKAAQLSKYQSKKIKIVVCQELAEDHCLNIKTKIREKYSEYVNEDLYITVHSSDSVEESHYLNSILISGLNILRLKQRGSVSRKMLGWLTGYFEILNDINIRKDATCIVGSSTMDILGLRASTDLDFILHSNYRNKLFSDNVCVLSDDVDLVTKGYLKPAEIDINDDKVIGDSSYHFYFRGFKFIDIDFVKKRKIAQSRKKDISDVKIIKKWESEKKTNSKVEIIKYLVWFYVIARAKYYKNRTRLFLKKVLPESVVTFLKEKLK